MIIVEPGDPRAEGPRALLEASHALMQSLFPAGACHFLSIDALCGDDVRFFQAREGNVVLGTGGYALRPGYGEVKSMFTAPQARGKGVAAAILRQIEDAAREEGLPVLKLETGAGLDAAHRLYERFGFDYCAAFGDYQTVPTSLFMEKTL